MALLGEGSEMGEMAALSDWCEVSEMYESDGRFCFVRIATRWTGGATAPMVLASSLHPDGDR